MSERIVYSPRAAAERRMKLILEVLSLVVMAAVAVAAVSISLMAAG